VLRLPCFLLFFYFSPASPPYNPNTYSVFNICSTLDVLYILDSFTVSCFFFVLRASRWLFGFGIAYLISLPFGARFSTYECRDASEKSIYKYIRYTLVYAMLLYPISYSIPIFLPCLRFCLLACLPRYLLWGYTLASMHALLCMIILVVHVRSRSCL